jgi:hypothetical protein
MGLVIRRSSIKTRGLRVLVTPNGDMKGLRGAREAPHGGFARAFLSISGCHIFAVK